MASITQRPPSYILQNWHGEQANVHEKYLSQQTFIIAPDGAKPFSRIRQRLRNIYEERTKPRLVIRYDPWDKTKQVQTKKDILKSRPIF